MTQTNFSLVLFCYSKKISHFLSLSLSDSNHTDDSDEPEEVDPLDSLLELDDDSFSCSL